MAPNRSAAARHGQESRGAAAQAAPVHGDQAWRETIESIVIAFILAFLFRGFQAEGFVIPTGSMGPTLMGLHKDLECPKCGYLYQVGASKYIDQVTGQRRGNSHVSSSTCPMCRYRADLTDRNPLGKDYLDYSGDRLQVGKFLHWMQPPQRWDVTVFKYPHGPETNYIKRMVGLPGETIRIRNGDLHVRPQGSDEFAIARKPPDKVLAMMQPVDDTEYVLDEMLAAGWPPRWGVVEQDVDGAKWVTNDGGRSFQIEGAPASPAWIGFRNIVASYTTWQKIEQGALQPRDVPPPQLVTDFCFYNSDTIDPPGPVRGRESQMLGLHWVGDLILECELEVERAAGAISFQLTEGGRRHTCRIDLSSGIAQLSIDGLPDFAPQGQTDIRAAGTYRVRFANVDDQLHLWVKSGFRDQVIEFDAPATFVSSDAIAPMPGDLMPVRIGAEDTDAVVQKLRIFRDVYYIATREQTHRDLLMDYPPGSDIESYLTEEKLAELMSNPQRWGVLAERLAGPPVDLVIQPQHYLMLGDNSAGSMDSRLWGARNPSRRLPDDHLVHEDLLVGKALFVYWPHAWEVPWNLQIPNTNVRVPFYPNFAKFRRIR